eukprot:gene1357-3298_t
MNEKTCRGTNRGQTGINSQPVDGRHTPDEGTSPARFATPPRLLEDGLKVTVVDTHSGFGGSNGERRETGDSINEVSSTFMSPPQPPGPGGLFQPPPASKDAAVIMSMRDKEWTKGTGIHGSSAPPPTPDQ